MNRLIETLNPIRNYLDTNDSNYNFIQIFDLQHRLNKIWCFEYLPAQLFCSTF